VLLVLALACGFEDMVSGFAVQTGFATSPALPCKKLSSLLPRSDSAGRQRGCDLENG
jgi:hypothetical protein